MFAEQASDRTPGLPPEPQQIGKAERLRAEMIELPHKLADVIVWLGVSAVSAAIQGERTETAARGLATIVERLIARR